MNTDWRDPLLMSVYMLALKIHLTSERDGPERVAMPLWMWLQPRSRFSGSLPAKYCFSPQIAFIPLWKWGLLSGLKSGVISVMPLPFPLLLLCCWRRTSPAIAAWLDVSMAFRCSLQIMKTNPVFTTVTTIHTILFFGLKNRAKVEGDFSGTVWTKDSAMFAAIWAISQNEFPLRFCCRVAKQA